MSHGEVVSMVSGSSSLCRWHDLLVAVNYHSTKVGLSRTLIETMKWWKLWALGFPNGSEGALVRWWCYPW